MLMKPAVSRRIDQTSQKKIGARGVALAAQSRWLHNAAPWHVHFCGQRPARRGHLGVDAYT
jgi:hypothetical protein